MENSTEKMHTDFRVQVSSKSKYTACIDSVKLFYISAKFFSIAANVESV